MQEDNENVKSSLGVPMIRISWQIEDMSNGHVNSDCVGYVPTELLEKYRDENFELADTVSDALRLEIFEILLSEV